MKYQAPVTRGALLLMESLWVYALAAFFVAITVGGGKPSLLGAGAVVFASFAISRLLQQSDLSLGPLRLWGMLLSFLIFYAIMRVDFFADLRFWDFTWADDLFNHTEASLEDHSAAVLGIPVLWGFWIRGVLRGQQNTGFESVIGSFAIGLVVIACVQVLANDATPRAVDYVAVPYVGVGLIAIALANAKRADDDFGRSLGAGWFITIGSIVGVLAIFSLIFVILDLDSVRAGLGHGGKAIGTVIAYVAYGILYPFIWLTDLTLGYFGDVLEKLFSGADRQNRIGDDQQEPPPPEQGESHVPGWLSFIARLFVGGGLLSVILVSTWFLFTRFRKRAGPSEVRESTYMEGRLGADLGGFIGAFLGRLRPHFATGPNLDAVRRLYFEVLNAGADRGIERRAGETPLELAPRLDEGLSTTTPGQITAAFDDVRYGAIAPPREEVERLRREWESAKR